MILKKRVDDTGATIIENGQYLFVITDKVEHFLFGIEKDGSVDWSKGIPRPIKNELDRINSEIENIKQGRFI